VQEGRRIEPPATPGPGLEVDEATIDEYAAD